MSVDDRQNFQTLRRVFCAGAAALRKWRNIDSGVLMAVPCATNKFPDAWIEVVPLARTFEYTTSLIALPAPGQEGSTVRAELN